MSFVHGVLEVANDLAPLFLVSLIAFVVNSLFALMLLGKRGIILVFCSFWK
jgi:hypothetical protein